MHSNAQYISSVNIPDTTQAIVDDPADLSVKYAASITAADIKSHLDVLASDEFEGRETGEPGNDKASVYISNYFESLDIEKKGSDNSYFQPVAFTTTKWENTEMFIAGKRYKHLWDYLAFPSMNNDIPFIGATEIVYLGYGIDDPNYNDYKGAKVKDKVVMIYNGEPMSVDSVSTLTGSKTMSSWTTDPTKKLERAYKAGAKLVLIIENDLKAKLNANRRILLGGQMALGDLTTEEINYPNHVYISPKTAQLIWGDKEKDILKARDNSRTKGKSKSIKIDQNFAIRMDKNQSVLKGKNVLAYIEGTDKKEELIVVSAHYDHIGMRADAVYNGADDNASGTSSVLDIAEAFQMAKNAGEGPSRSILCMLVTGEEKGLLGSQYYSENPIFPIENTVANVNVDMIGRIDDKYKDDPNYIYVIGSDRLSTDLHNVNAEVNQKYSQIVLDYTYNSEEDPNRFYYRSDHYNFARKGVPAIFFFSGVHKDYHRTTDTPDKILFDKTEKIARMIFHTAWELANRKDRITVDGEVKTD
jgi:hypothetical protein